LLYCKFAGKVTKRFFKWRLLRTVGFQLAYWLSSQSFDGKKSIQKLILFHFLDPIKPFLCLPH
jgi:hypothetical protein